MLEKDAGRSEDLCFHFSYCVVYINLKIMMKRLAVLKYSYYGLW